MKHKLAAAALALSAAGIPATAIAQGAPVPKMSEGIFPNRGQCEAALHRVRNETRELLRPLFAPNVVNRAIRESVYCAPFRNGFAVFAPPTS